MTIGLVGMFLVYCIMGYEVGYWHEREKFRLELSTECLACVMKYQKA